MRREFTREDRFTIGYGDIVTDADGSIIVTEEIGDNCCRIALIKVTDAHSSYNIWDFTEIESRAFFSQTHCTVRRATEAELALALLGRADLIEP